MRRMTKIGMLAAFALASFIGLADEDYGSETIGSVTFDYWWWAPDEAGPKECCSIEGLSVDDDFDGNLILPSELGGHKVTGIDYWDRDGFAAVKSVQIPAGYRNSLWALDYFTNLESVVVAEGNARYQSIDGVLYERVASNYLSLACYPPAKKSAEYTLPENVFSFSMWAHYHYEWVDDEEDEGCCGGYEKKVIGVNPYLKTLKVDGDSGYGWIYVDPEACPNLTTLYVPALAMASGDCNFQVPTVDTLYITGDSPIVAFSSGSHWRSAVQFPKLQKIVFTGCVEEIVEESLEDISSLKSVMLPTGLKRIGTRAFAGCTNLTDMVIPSTVTSIGKYAFASCPAVDTDDEDFTAALDLLSAEFVKGTDKAWRVDFKNSISGVASMKSASLNVGETSTLGIKASATGTLSFWWKVTASTLKVLVNGREAKSISDVGGWMRVEMQVAKGDVITWECSKPSWTMQESAGWVDLLKMPDAPIETDAIDTGAKLSKGRYFDKAEWTRLATRLDNEIAAAPGNYKLRIYRAAATVAAAVFDKRLQTLFEKSGYTVNVSDLFAIDDLKASGKLSFDGFPKTDEAIDTLAEILVPALVAAQADLNVIPEDWAGQVELSANLVPILSETVYVDKGDVLLAKAGFEGVLAAIDYLQAQQLNVSYAKLPVDFPAIYTENFSKQSAVFNLNKIPFTKSSLDAGIVIRDVSADSIEITGQSDDWDGISNVAKMSSRKISAGDDSSGYENVEGVVEWLKVARNGNNLYVAFKVPGWTPSFADGLNMSLQVRSGNMAVVAYKDCCETHMLVAPIVPSILWNGEFDIYDYPSPQSQIVMNGDFVEMKIVSPFVGELSDDADISVTIGGEVSSPRSHYESVGITARPASAEPMITQFMADHPEFLNGIRNAGKLAQSKSRTKEVLRLVLAADAAIASRTDSVMHFFEYDPVYADYRQDGRRYVEKVVKSLDAPESWELKSPDTAKCALDENVRICLGALFDSRGITRGLLPAIDDENVVNLNSIPDPTFRGLLPDATIDYMCQMINKYAPQIWSNPHVAFSGIRYVEDGVLRMCKEGETVFASAPEHVTIGRTNIVCIGWVGTGDVPASGSGSSVFFTLTQASSITWLYKTNCWFSVMADKDIEPIGADFKATTYNGYLCREADGAIVGTVQVKAAKAKANKKSGKTTSKLTITVQMADSTKKISISGDYDLSLAEEQTFAKSGRTISLLLGANGMTGAFEGYAVEGAIDVYSAKDATSKAAASAADAAYVGTYNLIADEGTFTVTVAKKGKVKVSGKTAVGKSVSVSTQLIVGEDAACAPVMAPKQGLSFAVWFADGGVTADGLSGAVAGKAGSLAAGAKFALDADALAAMLGDATYAAYFPSDIAVAQSGAKWVVADGAKAGKVAVDKNTGLVDESKLGANPSGLKLTYTAKTGAFKGSFKAYVDNRGKPKAVTVSVAGVLVNGVGYGTASVKKYGSVTVKVQ